MKTLKIIVTLILTLSLILAQFGCVEKQISKEQLLENVTHAHEKFKTYQTDSDMSLNVSSDDVGALDMGLTINTTAIFDNVMRKMMVTTEMDIPFGGSVESVTYIIDDMFYTKSNDPNTPDVWYKINLPEDYWEQQDEQQAQLLESSDFEIVNWEKVNGIRCHAVVINPNIQQMWKIVQEQGLLNLELLEMYGITPEEIIQDMDIHMWYSDQTYLPVKQVISATMKLPSEDTLQSSDEIVLDMIIHLGIETNMVYHSFNERVSIELPPEAEDATDLTDMMMEMES